MNLPRQQVAARLQDSGAKFGHRDGACDWCALSLALVAVMSTLDFFPLA